MNILFVHEIDWLRKVVFEIHTLSELLSLRGHRVYAIDYESMWQKNGPFDFGSWKTKSFIVNRAYPKAAVSLIRPGFIKIPGLSRISAAVTHSETIEKTIREKNIDVVVLYSVPTNGLQTVRIAGKLGVPVVFRAIDILNQLVAYPLLRPLTRILEKKVYTRADLLLALSPRLGRYLVDMGAAEGKVKLLPLGVDTDTFRPGLDTAAVRQKWGLKKTDRIIVFIGTLYGFSGLDAFIREFVNIVKEVPEAKLLIVGDGPQRRVLDKVIGETGLAQQVVITGFQPFDTVPQYINTGAVCINTFNTTPVTRDIFPTKIVQYLACGQPVLATPLPGMTAIAAGEGQGIVYAGSPAALAAETVSLLKSGERRRQLGQAGLTYVKHTHGYAKIAQQLEEHLAKLVGKG